MKNINKNSTWLSLTVITLLLFIIGFYAIGFKVSDQEKIFTLTAISDVASGANPPGYFVSANALFVTGLVFMAIDISLVITKWILDELNVKTKLQNKYWDYVFLGIVILTVIFLIAGSALFINKIITDTTTNPTGAGIDSGKAAGIFILFILTIPLNIIPLFIPNTDGPKPASVESTNVIDTEIPKDETKTEA